jgi:gluconolactonase
MKHLPCCFVSLALAALPAGAADEGGVGKVGLPEGLIGPDVKPAAASTVAFLEGPAAHAGGSVYFSDIAGNRILKRDASGTLSVFRPDSGRTNGNAFDARGRLISCEGAEMGPGGRRRIVRTDLTTGKVEVLAERYEGKRFNSPNDAAWTARPRVVHRSATERTEGSGNGRRGRHRISLTGRSRASSIRRTSSVPTASPCHPTSHAVRHRQPSEGRWQSQSVAFEIADGTPGRSAIYDFGKGRGGTVRAWTSRATCGGGGS